VIHATWRGTLSWEDLEGGNAPDGGRRANSREKYCIRVEEKIKII